jgi:hypothetical protein
MAAAQSIRSFVVCHFPGASNAVRLLPVTAQAQQDIEGMIRSQCDNFIAPELTRVDFDPTFKTDEETIIVIAGFQLPEHVADALSAPAEVPALKKAEAEEIRKAKYLFHVDEDENIYFQCWRNFSVLNRQKIWMLLSNDTLDVERDKSPIVLDHRLDAVLWKGDLLFKSVANVGSMLELTEYVIEATTEDISTLVDCEFFTGDFESILRNCSRLQKKQIRVLVQSGMLESHTFEELVEKAASVQYEIPQRDGKIALPNGGAALTELLQFLSDKLYCGPVTGDTFVANSSRRRAAR